MGRFFVVAAALGVSAVTQMGVAQAIQVLPAGSGASCPVGLSAERRTTPGSAVALTGDGAAEAGRVSLVVGLEPVGAARPVAALAILHGVSLNTRFVPVGTSVESSESVALAPQQGEHVLRRTVVASRQLQGVSWLELTEIRFADGKTWHPSHGLQCTAEPNGVLRVSDGR